MSWTPEQERALGAIRRWLDKGDQQVFRLAGLAGTGKTTLAREAMGMVRGPVYFAALTGKAAHVLTRKGSPARTIHSLMYKPPSRSRERLLELERAVAELRAEDPLHPRVRELEKEADEERANLARPAFKLDLESPLREAGLIVVDEASMIDQQMGEDLEYWGRPILAIGDPGQLPPVFGRPHFDMERPDFMLHEIHRQARDNPIIELSHRIRRGERLSPGNYGDTRVLHRREVSQDLILGADQILCGTHDMRLKSNERYRAILGHDDPYPVRGDRLVCLRNNHDAGLLNGQIWRVLGSQHCRDEGSFELTIEEEESGLVVETEAHEDYFRYTWETRRGLRRRSQETPAPWEVSNLQCFDYAYALTVHKAQGSQWPSVVVFNDWRGQDWSRWAYTAVTRAAERLDFVLW